MVMINHGKPRLAIWIVLIVLLISLISPVMSLPNTIQATMIGNNNATLNSDSNTGVLWYEYGQQDGCLSWKTPNTTLNAFNIYGSPLSGNTLFYFRACDATGCGNQLSFTTLPLTPQPETTFGISIDNITNSQYDIVVASQESIKSYFWATPTMPIVVWGILFFGIYLALWIRQRDLVVPVILGLITGTFLMSATTGLGLGIPQDFLSVAQGLTYAALAGIILAWIKRS